MITTIERYVEEEPALEGGKDGWRVRGTASNVLETREVREWSTMPDYQRVNIRAK